MSPDVPFAAFGLESADVKAADGISALRGAR